MVKDSTEEKDFAIGYVLIFSKNENEFSSLVSVAETPSKGLIKQHQ